MITTALSSATAASPTPEAAGTTVSAKSVEAFNDALLRQSAGQNDAPEQIAQAAGSVPAQTPVSDPEAQSRARRGLGLEGDGLVPATGGDMILNGLQKLRGVFDARELRVSELMNRSSLDAGTMMAMQMEVTNFTLMVDLTSKLTGKSTQAFDTLMKGQ